MFPNTHMQREIAVAMEASFLIPIIAALAAFGFILTNTQSSERFDDEP